MLGRIAVGDLAARQGREDVGHALAVGLVARGAVGGVDLLALGLEGGLVHRDGLCRLSGGGGGTLGNRGAGGGLGLLLLGGLAAGEREGEAEQDDGVFQTESSYPRGNLLGSIPRLKEDVDRPSAKPFDEAEQGGKPWVRSAFFLGA
ncbi:hypothetical protein D3C86_1487570 [compost metagenome]